GAGAGVADGIGDDLLGTAQQHVGALGVLDVQRLGQVQADVQGRHALGQGADGAAEVQGTVLAHLADRFAHVGQQQPGQGVALPDVLLGTAFGEVGGHLQVQAQGGQVVAEQVVQL